MVLSRRYGPPRKPRWVPTRRSSDLDPAYGGTGRVVLPTHQAFGSSVAVQADGAMLVGGGKTSPFEAMRIADRKSTRLNSSHANTSYAVFCVIKKSPVWILDIIDRQV